MPVQKTQYEKKRFSCAVEHRSEKKVKKKKKNVIDKIVHLSQVC